MFEEAITDADLASLQAAERASGEVFLRQCEALLAVWDSSPEDCRTGRQPHVLAEAGLALGLHAQSVDARLGIAMALRDQPLLRGLLHDGCLGVAHVMVCVDGTGALGDDDLATKVLQEVLASGGRLGWEGTPAELRRALVRAAVRLDPAAAARRRAEQQQRRAGVRLRPLPDGLAAWIATGAAEQLLAADRLLDVASRRHGPDDDRSYGQRQLDALLGALVAKVGHAVPIEVQLEVPVSVDASVPVAQPGGPALPEPVVISVALSAELLALLDPTGPVAVGSARLEPLCDVHPTAEGVAPADPAGRGQTGDGFAAGDSLTSAPSAADGVAADDTAPGDAAPGDTAPGDTAPGDAALDDAAPAARKPPHREPELHGLGTVDPGLLRDLLRPVLPVGLSGVRVRRVFVDATGQVVAVDARAVALERLLAREGPSLLRRVTSDLPVPPPTTGSYEPTAAQTRVVRARDRRCRFPGCFRAAARSELDHRDPFPRGSTSVANLHPLCRHHHRLKHDGWSCVRDRSGATTWTSPRGQQYTVAPG